MRDRELAAIGRRLLRPYGISRECPYLSEDQRELSTLDLQGRSAWMAEWLWLAASAKPLKHNAAQPQPGKRSPAAPHGRGWRS